MPSGRLAAMSTPNENQESPEDEERQLREHDASPSGHHGFDEALTNGENDQLLAEQDDGKDGHADE